MDYESFIVSQIQISCIDGIMQLYIYEVDGCSVKITSILKNADFNLFYN